MKRTILCFFASPLLGLVFGCGISALFIFIYTRGDVAGAFSIFLLGLWGGVVLFYIPSLIVWGFFVYIMFKFYTPSLPLCMLTGFMTSLFFSVVFYIWQRSDYIERAIEYNHDIDNYSPPFMRLLESSGSLFGLMLLAAIPGSIIFWKFIKKDYVN